MLEIEQARWRSHGFGWQASGEWFIVLSFINKAKLLFRKAQFRMWKRKHPSAPFTDYFAEIARKDVERRRAHPTLGGNLSGDPFGTSGRETFLKLVRRYNIEPQDVCVDYGCGTLRVGVHAIEYLNPGCYWGLEITDFFLSQGRELIGSRLENDKAPNLRVISAASVGEAAAAEPKILFSISVLMHVHPDELSAYMANIISIIGEAGLGVVAAQWTDAGTIQIGRQSWVHSEPSLRDAVEIAGGSAKFIEREKRPDCVSGAIEVRKTK